MCLYAFALHMKKTLELMENIVTEIKNLMNEKKYDEAYVQLNSLSIQVKVAQDKLNSFVPD